MFRALICPSSGARDYTCVIAAYGGEPAALLLTADHQQPRHYTPYAAITQV
jgi:hypothetical protein